MKNLSLLLLFFFFAASVSSLAARPDPPRVRESHKLPGRCVSDIEAFLVRGSPIGPRCCAGVEAVIHSRARHNPWLLLAHRHCAAATGHSSPPSPRPKHLALLRLRAPPAQQAAGPLAPAPAPQKALDATEPVLPPLAGGPHAAPPS